MRYSYIALLGLGCTMLTAAQDKQPFSISISAPSSVKSGGDVYIQITMHNASNKPVDCTEVPSNALDLRFRYVVKDSSGQPIKARISKHPELEGAGSIRMCVLNPGLTTTPEDVLLSRRYDFLSPGPYTVSVLRAVDDKRPEQYVESNTVTITVAP